MKSAETQLKKDCPDWKDWPAGAFEAQIALMQKYAAECILADREQVIMTTPDHLKGEEKVLSIGINPGLIRGLNISTP